MPISEANKKEALEGYLHYSRILDNDDLKRFYRDLDFTALCNVRDLLAEADLTEDEEQLVTKADDRLRESFDTETLQLYADYFPELPIRDWWG